MEMWQQRWDNVKRAARSRWQAGQSLGEIAMAIGAAETTVALLLPDEEMAAIEEDIERMAAIYDDPARREWVRRTMRRWATREALGR